MYLKTYSTPMINLDLLSELYGPAAAAILKKMSACKSGMQKDNNHKPFILNWKAVIQAAGVYQLFRKLVFFRLATLIHSPVHNSTFPPSPLVY